MRVRADSALKSLDVKNPLKNKVSTGTTGRYVPSRSVQIETAQRIQILHCQEIRMPARRVRGETLDLGKPFLSYWIFFILFYSAMNNKNIFPHARGYPLKAIIFHVLHRATLSNFPLRSDTVLQRENSLLLLLILAPTAVSNKVGMSQKRRALRNKSSKRTLVDTLRKRAILMQRRR